MSCGLANSRKAGGKERASGFVLVCFLRIPFLLVMTMLVILASTALSLPLFSAPGLLIQDAFEKKPDPKWVSRFGRRYLDKAEFGAEVIVEHVYRVGRGVDVVKIVPVEVIFNTLPSAMARRDEHLLFAFSEHFMPGTRLFLLMKRFGSDNRLTVLYRLSHLERDYKDKLDLVRRYVQIETMNDKQARHEAFVALVLANVADESEWIRKNSLHELEGLLDGKLTTFTSGDVEYLKGIEAEADNPIFEKWISRLIDKMEPASVEGPPTLGKTRKEGDGKEPKKDKIKQKDGKNGNEKDNEDGKDEKSSEKTDKKPGARHP